MRDETCYCNQYAGLCMARGVSTRFDSGGSEDETSSRSWSRFWGVVATVDWNGDFGIQIDDQRQTQSIIAILVVVSGMTIIGKLCVSDGEQAFTMRSKLILAGGTKFPVALA